jgi:hypothetical protein
MLRAFILSLTFLVAFMLMHDVGFTPEARFLQKTATSKSSVDHGLRNSPVRWLMPAPVQRRRRPLRPHATALLELYGRSDAYAIAGSPRHRRRPQIVGGLVPHVRKIFRRRTSLLLAAFDQRRRTGTHRAGGHFGLPGRAGHLGHRVRRLHAGQAGTISA